MHTIYRPGAWNTLVVPGGLVAVPSEAPQALVTALWERLNGERTLAAVVDVITDSVGGSFSAMPSFVAVVLEGANARVAIRGGIAAEVAGSDGVQTLSGADVTTWSERFIPGIERVALRLDDASGSPELPVVGGVVRAAEVVAEVEPDDRAVAAVPDAGAQSDAEQSGDAGAEAPIVVPFSDPEPVAEVEPVAEAEPVPVPEPAPVSEVEPVPAPEPAPVSEREPGSEPELVSDPEPAPVAEPEPPVIEPTPEPAASEPESFVPASAGSDAPTVALEVAPDVAPDAAPAEIADGDQVSGETLIPAEQTLGSDDFDEFQQLFGDTVHSAPSAARAPITGDHDGATISVAEARALRNELPPVPQLEPEASTALLPALGGGRIRVSTGQVVALDRTIVIGRRPRAPRASGASLPHLIAVESPQQDISRSHLEIRPEGDTVVVIDLHTTNGSTLLRTGADPVRLHPGEQTLVLDGDVIDLGDGVTVAFEDLP